ncbi:MAG: hypothetical protein HY735_04775 [Verrucomicrobia bacterium]|nr:hypothetical protein [Verrucomicrobiota bacterium]
MKVNPQSFFKFCSGHVPLLRQLAESGDEISEADARRVIRANLEPGDELPETTWRRLKELQILIPIEPASDFNYLAEPVARLLAYLYDEAQAATPEIVRGYIESLTVTGKQLARAIETDDLGLLRLAMDEIQRTLRRVQTDLDETHRCILAEVSRYKTERRTVPVREKFRRIVHWMERYVDPMVDIVRPDGPLRATFDETERLLHRARDHGLFNDLPALERSFRQLRLVQRHALRVFQQCRRELQPLYESLRRSSFIAEGAALALEQLQREGSAGWAEVHAATVCSLRWQNVPGDAAIERTLRNVAEHRPEPAPVLALSAEEAAPADYLRRLWLDALPSEARASLPLTDLLDWLVQPSPKRDTADTLAGFSRLVFDPAFEATFTEDEPQEYRTANGVLEAPPVRLARA